MISENKTNYNCYGNILKKLLLKILNDYYYHQIISIISAHI